MRTASIDDAWRHTRSPRRDCPWIETITIGGLQGFATQVISIQSSIAVFCGPNASGKSRLIRGAYAAMTEEDQALHVEFSSSERAINAVAYVDLFALTSLHLRSIYYDQALQERIDQAGDFKPLSNTELRALNWLLGVEYDSLDFIELEATEVDDPSLELDAAVTDTPDEYRPSVPIYRPEAVPYFRAQRGHLSYTSATASRGELAAWTLFWALRTIENGSLLLLDEPEMFLSPHSSARVVDFVAVNLDKRSSGAIIASHSPQALLRAPIHVRHVLQDGANGITRSEGTTDQLWSALRIAQAECIVFAVEDRAGKVFVEFLLSKTTYEHKNVTAIWIAEGEGNVRLASRLPQNRYSTFSIYGIFDGDERKRSASAGINSFFLPGEVAPEEFILDCMIDDPSLLTHDEDEVKVLVDALASTRGEDVHERLDQIGGHVGRTADHLIQTILGNWLRTTPGREYLAEFEGFVRAIALPALRQ